MPYKAPGRPCEHYREQLMLNPASYAGTALTDDYFTNVDKHLEPNYESPAAPSAPVVTTAGTAATTDYKYAVQKVMPNGNTSANSTKGDIATGAATLNSTDYNIVTVPTDATAAYFKIYRTDSAGTPATTGFIGTALSAGNLHDTGLPVIADPSAGATQRAEQWDSWYAALKQGGQSF